MSEKETASRPFVTLRYGTGPLASLVGHSLCSLPSSLRSSFVPLVLGPSSRRACDSGSSSPRPARVNGRRFLHTSLHLGFRHSVHTALPSASPGTGPREAVRSSFLFTSASRYSPFVTRSVRFSTFTRGRRPGPLLTVASRVTNGVRDKGSAGKKRPPPFVTHFVWRLRSCLTVGPLITRSPYSSGHPPRYLVGSLRGER